MIEERITGETRLAAVIGNPIEHSISPQLHNTLSRLMGADFAYVAARVVKERLEDAVKGFCALGFAGFNVTIPYKTRVIEYIDSVSENASLVGAVNTVKINGGKMTGYNTDGEGFLRSFRDETGTGFENRTIAVLGAGGAAKSIIIKVLQEGAKKVFVMNRTVSKAEKLCKTVYEKFGGTLEPVPLKGSLTGGAVLESDVIINTTPAGMYPDTGSMPLNTDTVFREGQVVYDTIYNPSETMLIKNAGKHGCKTVNGLGMLIYQGIAAYEIWMEVNVPDDIGSMLVDKFKKYMNK